jgi:NADP-dependent 3-hydroxy acid dehydrogenase YdfG
MAQAHKVWFMTGTSRGFGRVLAEAALERGDKVAAAARDTGSLTKLARRYGDDVLPIRLDVSNKAAVDAAVARAHDYFGRLDVIVNNAGQGLFGTAEGPRQEQVRAQLDTNFFGALWVTRAALPYLRAQGSGHIIQVSSIGFSQSLSQEARDLGFKVTVVEPAGSGAREVLEIVDRAEYADRLATWGPWNELLERAHDDTELAVQR